MYMPNTRILRLEPNRTYILLTHVGVLHWVTILFLAFLDTNMLV